MDKEKSKFIREVGTGKYIKFPNWDDLKPRELPVVDSDYICTNCGFIIPGGTDDNYNSDHTRIMCPDCDRWLDLGPPRVEDLPAFLEGVNIQPVELYLSRRFFAGAFARIMLFKKEPIYRKNKGRKYGFWTRRGGALFEFCAGQFLNATGIKIPFDKLIMITEIHYTMLDDRTPVKIKGENKNERK